MAKLTHAAAGAAVEAADALMDARVSQMTIPLRDLLDPDQCPVRLLPWLAWSRGLVYWRSDWDELTQRRVIRTASLVLRERGTRRGVERQLGTLGSAVQITEWWETSPKGTPGTWRVQVTSALGAETDLEIQDEINAALARTAPLSRPWTIGVGVSGTAPTLTPVYRRSVARGHITGSSEI